MKIKIELEIKEIENKIKILKDELKLKYDQLLSIQFKVNIGDIIHYNGKKYKIIGFERYWPVGRLIKKDGTESKVIHSLFYMEKS